MLMCEIESVKYKGEELEQCRWDENEDFLPGLLVVSAEHRAERVRGVCQVPIGSHIQATTYYRVVESPSPDECG